MPSPGGHALRRRAVCLARLALAPRSVVPPAGLPPVLLAVVLAAATAPRISVFVSVLLVVGTAIAGIMVVAVNDLADEAVDAVAGGYVSHVSGGSRILQDGLVTRRELEIWVAGLAATGAVCFGIIVWFIPWQVMPLLALEFGLALGYSAGPRLVSTSMGEAALATACGIVPMATVYLAVSSTWAWPVLLVGAAPSALAMIMLVSAHVLDRDADAAAGKRTLAVRLAPRWHTPLEVAVLAVGAVAIGTAAAVGFVPAGAAFVVCCVLAWCVRVTWGTDHAEIVRTTTTANLAACTAVGVAVRTEAVGIPPLGGVALAAGATMLVWGAWAALQRRLFEGADVSPVAVSAPLRPDRPRLASRRPGGPLSQGRKAAASAPEP
ncbi:MAG: prenyltransferase [Acidimicrobiia bacterium]|nr:prenyltransferase [Acidimicrobiia bacterium]